MSLVAVLPGSTLTPDLILSRASIRRDAALCAESISPVSFSTGTSKLADLRFLKGLEDYPDPIVPGDVVVDSDMSLPQAFEQIAPECPDDILARQELLPVYYFGEDGKLHRGQVVIHAALAPDIELLFAELRKQRIPVHSMIPASHPSFRDDHSRWSDLRSMDRNNGYSFSYRLIVTATGQLQRLSLHSLGLALDINPVWNPCYGDPAVHLQEFRGAEAAAGYRAKVPAHGQHDFANPGSFHNRHPAVLLLKDLGWTWGGEWGDPKDLHHFQKIPAEIKGWVEQYRR